MLPFLTFHLTLPSWALFTPLPCHILILYHYLEFYLFPCLLDITCHCYESFSRAGPPILFIVKTPALAQYLTHRKCSISIC